MGQILASLNLRGGTDSIVPEIHFDIENARPISEELGVYNELHALLVQPNSNLLNILKEYKPASDEIRNAIATPNQENEDKAWNAILPTVDALREFYSYSSELERGIPMLLNVLCKDGGGTTKDLDRHPGLTRLFAEILDFVFEFDYLKIRNPTLQNDFSFYRRTLQRGRAAESTLTTPTSPEKEHSNQSDLRLAINEDDLANRISLFIAYPTPMLKCVIDTATKYVQSNQLTKGTSEWLSSIWAVCYQTLNANYKKSSSGPVDTFCLKVMVVSIILYDHIDPSGAFTKTSPINVKNSLKTIQNVNQVNRQEQSSTSNLVCALRYNSKHLNDESTPKGIKNFVMTI
ncbi:FAM49 family protein [Mucor ambiguus]|uniref:FAM49 family protein n=1 Tax=Mucor ambiguus TaxID=91626 RepID=A0A0C9MLF4_9FUNG|nr:FAM49 family protein [Mucor ambiguus]